MNKLVNDDQQMRMDLATYETNMSESLNIKSRIGSMLDRVKAKREEYN